MTMNETQSQTAIYQRARQELKAALEDLTARADRLIRARYRRGELIRSARMLRVDAIDIVTMAVLAERAKGATWDDVAEALTLPVKFVIEHYEPLERQWITGNGIAPVIAETMLRSLG